jgi:hypothetical protein
MRNNLKSIVEKGKRHVEEVKTTNNHPFEGLENILDSGY